LEKCVIHSLFIPTPYIISQTSSILSFLISIYILYLQKHCKNSS